jgi:hypothetical protein
MNDYNPRYLKYCQAHGMTPEEMDNHDRMAYPGGCMTRYILWINQKWCAWRNLNNYYGPKLAQHHEAFDAWL